MTKLIYDSDEVADDGVIIGVPFPILLADPDEIGCNWHMDMDYFGNAGVYLGSVLVAVEAAKSRWNLKV